MIAAIAACGPSTVADDRVEADPSPVPAEPVPVPRIDDPFGAENLAALEPQPRLSWPVESVHITSYFGWRTDPVTGKGTRLHKGLDLRGRIGDLVLSIGDGIVAFSGHDPLLGTMVIVDHGDGLESWYGHLDATHVHAGLRVVRGSSLGLVGNTGRSAAPHLHLTVKVHDVAIDPLAVLGQPTHSPEALVARSREPDTTNQTATGSN